MGRWPLAVVRAAARTTVNGQRDGIPFGISTTQEVPMSTEPRVLIIEDNEINRVLVRDMLRFKGYRTIETQTAEEGLRVAREQKPALILMDFHLPKLNGIEAFQALRAEPETSAIPVIAVTASAMPEDRKKIREAGFDGLQTKPIHVTDFLNTVERAMKSSQGPA